MKILSISVAAYNMEKLIRQNLDSFVSSKYADEIEVLVINDGSTDSTPDIVREYETKYPNTVRLITQDNAGPGSTVNRGMDNATGKYFRMVDADDWVGEGFDKYIEALKSTDADMVISNYICVDDVTGETEHHEFSVLPVGETVEFDSVCKELSLEMHAVTFRTEILQQNNIRLFNGFYTDIQYLLMPSPFIRTVMYTECDVYMYRVSLSGQSMAAPSMQRNVQQHDDMLFSIVELYNRTKDSRPSVAQYILAKLVYISGTEMGTLLSFEPNKESKARLYDFISRLRERCPEAYERFAQYKTAKVLNLLGGALYPLASRMHRKRLGL